ncbi:hypothetical protein GPUN_0903 [Glaciecola punicea ACAM 611]|uniref:Uncharacterized protein n=1 Tax=Glaciecola punicea ACAM 611 TaxID=1121923 RepID=H5T9Q7_9ALTE|nr:hypothetical protein GPUN_0903 [Glaciecola punicea ACAM 611]
MGIVLVIYYRCAKFVFTIKDIINKNAPNMGRFFHQLTIIKA